MILDELEVVLRDRLTHPPEGSYAATLLTDSERVRRKIMEEAFELTLELGRTRVDRTRTAQEAADLLFHVLVGLVAAGVPMVDVLAELEARRR